MDKQGFLPFLLYCLSVLVMPQLHAASGAHVRPSLNPEASELVPECSETFGIVLDINPGRDEIFKADFIKEALTVYDVPHRLVKDDGKTVVGLFKCTSAELMKQRSSIDVSLKLMNVKRVTFYVYQSNFGCYVLYYQSTFTRDNLNKAPACLKNNYFSEK